MNDRQRTARDRLRGIVATAPRHTHPVREDRDGGLPALRDVPALPLRVGRHLTAWLLWHTTGVSLIEDAPAPRRYRSAARI
jgi:hypothetical protein